MSKRCEVCGRFMRLTDYLPDDDMFDEELAVACGLTDEEIKRGHWDHESEYSRFVYVQDQWECDNCQTLTWNDKGKKYYWNPDSGDYDGEKPLTIAEKLEAERRAQEDDGQMRLL